MLVCSRQTSNTRLYGWRAEVDSLKIHNQLKQEPCTEHAVSGSTESDMNAVRTLFWPESHMVPSAKDIRRRELAYQGASKNDSMGEDLTDDNLVQTVFPFRDALTVHSPIIGHYVKDFLDVLLFIEAESRALSLIGLLPVVYGGIHLAAWGFEFPSPVESLLWKINCLIIMSSFFFSVGFMMGSKIVISCWYCLSRPGIYVYLAVWVYLGLYACARIFLVLESFLSLRHVPIGVYAAVPWVQNIPHI